MFDFTTIKRFLLDKELGATIETIKTIEESNANTPDISHIINLPQIPGSPVTLGTDVISDVELFNTYNNATSSSGSVLNALSQPHTFGGAKYLAHPSIVTGKQIGRAHV